MNALRSGLGLGFAVALVFACGGVESAVGADSLLDGQGSGRASRLPDRRIEVSRALQRARLIENGRLVRAIHVSTGAASSPTPPGRYVVYRKEHRSWSYAFNVWLPWASYFDGGIAFHAWRDVPAYPASHGCVRVPVGQAAFLYRFAVVGTPVIVT